MLGGPALSQPLPASAAVSSVSMTQSSSCGTASGFCFSPPSISTTVGSTVTWTDMTAAVHSATADPPGTWNTGALGPNGTSMAITFPTPGSFPYHCFFHPDMQGTVVVTNPSSPPAQYTALPPSRLLDTRNGGQPLEPGVAVNLTVAGGSTPVPASASAVVLNITVTNTSGPGFLTVWPTGNPRPIASNLNWAAGETRPNLVSVQIGITGLVALFASSRTDVIADLEGYFAAPSGTAGEYVGVAPSRLLDTRPGGAALTPGATLNVTVTGRGGVPSAGVSAVVLNVTVTNTTATGYLTAYPTSSARPTASNLNWVAGWTVPNRVIVPVGSGGQVSFFNFAGMTDLVVDVNGYFTDATLSGKRFNALSPARIADTRASNQKLGPAGTFAVQVGGVGVSSGATAAVLNVTVTNTTTAGFLTVFPGGTPPTASDLNFAAGQTIPNLVVATLSATGSVTIYNSSGSTDVVVDLVGWFG